MMTSRERVHRAIEGKPIDRVPIDLGCHFSTGISMFAYQNLRNYLGLPTDAIYVPDMIQCLARVDLDVLDRFHVDTILLNPDFPAYRDWSPRKGFSFRIPATADPKLEPDGSWIIHRNGYRLRMPAGGFFFDGGWPNFFDCPYDDYLDLFADQAKHIHNTSDRFTMFMELPALFGDMDFLCRMYTDPDQVHDEQKRTLEEQLVKAEKIIARMDGFVDALALNSDMGTQQGPMCAPALYEEFVYPYLKQLCSYIKSHSHMKLFHHTCGSIKPLIPYLIDAGIDAINPVQISAANMEPEILKAEFGDRLCFWGGGCNTQQILNNGSPADVRENVKFLMTCLKPNGRFVFSQVHNIMGDIKSENIVAMLDTAYENSFYEGFTN